MRYHRRAAADRCPCKVTYRHDPRHTMIRIRRQSWGRSKGRDIVADVAAPKKRTAAIPWTFKSAYYLDGWIFRKETRRGVAVRKVVFVEEAYETDAIVCGFKQPFVCSTWFVPYHVAQRRWFADDAPGMGYDGIGEFVSDAVEEYASWPTTDPEVRRLDCRHNRTFVGVLPAKPKHIRGFKPAHERLGQRAEEDYYLRCGKYGGRPPPAHGVQRRMP